jgi:hypothetical protein
MTYGTSYLNDLEPESVLESFLRSCLSRIAQKHPLKAEDSVAIAALLVDGHIARAEEVVKKVIEVSTSPGRFPSELLDNSTT